MLIKPISLAILIVLAMTACKKEDAKTDAESTKIKEIEASDLKIRLRFFIFTPVVRFRSAYGDFPQQR